MAKKVTEEQVTQVENDYGKTLSLWYNGDAHCWQIGPFVAQVFLTPSFSIKSTHNINAITINVINRGYDGAYNNFAMGFDSVGMDEKGSPILHTKFCDAFEQLKRNKSNLERYLKVNINIDELKLQIPVVLEFEKRADGRSPGHDELQII
jgi:hypothetical protein